PADAGPGRELHEAEGLRRGRVDHAPDIDVQLLTPLRELIRERNVDHPEGVLVDLDELGGLGALDGDDRVEDPLVKRTPYIEASFRDATHHLRGVLRRPDLVARVHSFGRVAEEEVLADSQSLRLEDRQQDLPRRPWVGRTLKDDQLAAPQRV